MLEPQPDDRHLARQIRFKIRQICKGRRMTASDYEVVEHDLRAHLAMALTSFDPAKAKLATFIDRLSERWLISYLRHRFAACRDPRRESSSLNDYVRDAEGDIVARHETMSDGADDGVHALDLSQRLAELMSRLPDDLRVVALMLANGTVNSVAEELGISRREVASRIERLRAILEAEGFNEHR